MWYLICMFDAVQSDRILNLFGLIFEFQFQWAVSTRHAIQCNAIIFPPLMQNNTHTQLGMPEISHLIQLCASFCSLSRIFYSTLMFSSFYGRVLRALKNLMFSKRRLWTNYAEFPQNWVFILDNFNQFLMKKKYRHKFWLFERKSEAQWNT